MSVFEVFAREEQRSLVSGMTPFQGHAAHLTTASKICLIRLDGEVVGFHERDFRRNRVAYDVSHYIPILERKPGVIRKAAPFRAEHLPAPLAQVQARLNGREDGGEQMVRIFLEARDHGLEVVAAACAGALEADLCNGDVIPNILSRRCEPGPMPEVATPAGLELRTEPVADCARYDMLLAREENG